MSKTVRKQLLVSIELLRKASGMIEDTVLNHQDTIALLTDCQDLAVALGCRIEAFRGMNTAVVPELEKYCEMLYVAGQALCQGEDIHSHCEKILKQVGEIEETFAKDFPDKLEVVFLPYKASMWDSLESVWMAARDDEDCEAYVVPIPYYDRNSDGSLGEMHYEGDLYPDYVPVVSYEEFDLELHHPDQIYIHNPYDEYNRVTSIAPEYYSSKIKDYTEELVYIPYFVLQEIDPSNQMAIEDMKHFCFLPGTMYAVKVIVQSENMRQIYINEFLKAAEAQKISVTRKELEKKILGLGSPKFDKALNTKKEDLVIPEEWLRKIEKPDGSWKKIVFYNTSLSAFLKNSEQMLVKIKDVLRVFKENKEEVALLWRPHPLMKQTVESMRPDLWRQYEAIVQQYREEDWGIYDDTADMDRVVVLSDAYYGDPSSVLNLYRETQKKIMIQNMYRVN